MEYLLCTMYIASGYIVIYLGKAMYSFSRKIRKCSRQNRVPDASRINEYCDFHGFILILQGRLAVALIFIVYNEIRLFGKRPCTCYLTASSRIRTVGTCVGTSPLYGICTQVGRQCVVVPAPDPAPDRGTVHAKRDSVIDSVVTQVSGGAFNQDPC